MIRVGKRAQQAILGPLEHALAGDKHFDVIISDVGLPDVRNNAFLHELHTETGLTGVTVADGRDDPPREFFTQPVTAVELHSAIRRQLPVRTGAVLTSSAIQPAPSIA